MTDNILKYKDFYGSVEYSAAKEGISLNTFVERAISDEVGALIM